MTKKKVLVIFGTRPEAIKLAPVIKELEKSSNIFRPYVCVTAQHREMLDQVLEIFNITPDFDLDLMTSCQELSKLSAEILNTLKSVIDKVKPDIIIVQGDTTTTFIASLVGFYSKVKIGYVEAGLRSFNKHSPYPEEINRQLTSVLADVYFAPTKVSRKNLIKENIPKNKIHITGNTIVDSVKFIKKNYIQKSNKSNKSILVTVHRRENWGKNLISVCQAVKKIAELYPEYTIIWPVHLNPVVKDIIYKNLSNIPNIKLMYPLNYLKFMEYLNSSILILTDSGGVQEEATVLGKPTLLLRDTTERPEALQSGTVKQVGCNAKKILMEVKKLLNRKSYYKKVAKKNNVFGDGNAAKKICKILAKL
ncbi:MAG: UDP-N-acetylglucosamine 2-epimerase (non-hydrolyzing) [Candidatus Aureabacteria bacterium]|nr:UDP-N-acetylglucosamine 2-epimerase (non-hydrolyzing) [Candidatus Auribacterota bacterium]